MGVGLAAMLGPIELSRQNPKASRPLFCGCYAADWRTDMACMLQH
jgi:hypothetical protein